MWKGNGPLYWKILFLSAVIEKLAMQYGGNISRSPSR
jgi:hypothetical protein